MSADDGVLEFPQRPGGVESELIAAIEALLFAAGEPLTSTVLAEVLDTERVEVQQALRVLAQQRADGGVVLERIAGGWQLRTSLRFAEVVHQLRGTRPQRLSRAALEVLSIVAWQQPITRPEIEQLRGVDSGGVLKSLLERNLVRVAGRSDMPGRPLLYRTTSAFLEMFSLPNLKALPTLAEREALVRDRAAEE